jgi:hypothetical protein
MRLSFDPLRAGDEKSRNKQSSLKLGLDTSSCVVSWVRGSRFGPEQRFADRLQLFFGQQTCFQSSFAEAVLVGRNNDAQVSRYIMD